MDRAPNSHTDAEIKELASILTGTTSNIFTVSLYRLGVEANDETWKRVDSVGELFKCETCGTWQHNDEKTSSSSEQCEECNAEAEEEDEEEN